CAMHLAASGWRRSRATAAASSATRIRAVSSIAPRRSTRRPPSPPSSAARLRPTCAASSDEWAFPPHQRADAGPRRNAVAPARHGAGAPRVLKVARRARGFLWARSSPRGSDGPPRRHFRAIVMNLRLYLLQRATAAIMAPLVLAHVAVIFYATGRGLSA